MNGIPRVDRRTAIFALCSGSFVRIANAEKGDPPITALTFSPDGAFIVAGSQAGLSIRDANSLDEVARLSPQMDNVHDVQYSSRGDLLAAAGGNPGVEGCVEFFQWPSRKRRDRILLHDDVIYAIDFAADDRFWVAASGDQVCSVHNGSSPKPVCRFTEHSRAVRDVVVLPGGRNIVTASRDETLRVWDGQTGSALRTLHNHSRDVNALALRPGENQTQPLVASASKDLTVRFWQPLIGRMVRFARLPSEPLCLTWIDWGASLVAGCRDGLIRVIDPVTVEITSEYRLSKDWLYAVAAHPEKPSTIAAGGADGKPHVREVTISSP